MAETAGLSTLLVGLDAACLPVLDDCFGAGATPNLRRVFESGPSEPLESQLPPWTPSAWPSLYTGVNPGKHGVYGFLSFEGYDWEVVDRTDVREFALWELLDIHDKSSVVVNVPVTGPPRPIDGAVIPGYTAPANPACHPDGVLTDVREACDGYEVFALRDPDESDEERLETLCSLSRTRGEAFRYLCDRFDPDFGFLQFQQTDTVCHEFPDDMDAIRRVYRAVDDALGTVLDRTDPDTVVVASDHGIGPYRGYEVRLNELLRATGFLETARGGEGMPSWDSFAREQLTDHGQSPSRWRGVQQSLAAAAARAGLTSQRAGSLLDVVGLKDVVADRVDKEAIRAGTEQVNFPASTAYMRSRVELGVRINLAGREPNGVVSQSEYDRVRESLVESLRHVTTPSGDPAFDRVAPREEVFHGPYLDEAPDVVVVPAGFDHDLTAALRGAPFEPIESRWSHKRQGVVAASGAGVDESVGLGTPHLLDVAPTVLATLGVPASDRMDGATLPAVESSGRESYPPFEAADDGATVGADVERHLADLGYLE